MKLSRYKHSSPLSYAFGATLCYELLKTKPYLITRVFLRPLDKHGNDLDKILSELKHRNIEIIETPKAFNILGAKDSCLLIAEFTKELKALQADASHIVLVNPSDTGNLGTIMRSAAAFNFRNLAIIGQAADPHDPKSVRASMGAIFHLNIAEFPDYASYQTAFPEHHGYAFMLDRRSKQLNDIIKEAKTQNYSLVFGNEAAGLPANFADSCQPVILKQSPLVDSLNLSTAASIAMYKFYAD